MTKKMGRPPLTAGQVKTERVLVSLSPAAKEALFTQARTQDVPASQVIRAALAEYLKGGEDRS